MFFQKLPPSRAFPLSSTSLSARQIAFRDQHRLIQPAPRVSVQACGFMRDPKALLARLGDKCWNRLEIEALKSSIRGSARVSAPPYFNELLGRMPESERLDVCRTYLHHQNEALRLDLPRFNLSDSSRFALAQDLVRLMPSFVSSCLLVLNLSQDQRFQLAYELAVAAPDEFSSPFSLQEFILTPQQRQQIGVVLQPKYAQHFIAASFQLTALSQQPALIQGFVYESPLDVIKSLAFLDLRAWSVEDRATTALALMKLDPNGLSPGLASFGVANMSASQRYELALSCLNRPNPHALLENMQQFHLSHGQRLELVQRLLKQEVHGLNRLTPEGVHNFALTQEQLFDVYRSVLFQVDFDSLDPVASGGNPVFTPETLVSLSPFLSACEGPYERTFDADAQWAMLKLGAHIAGWRSFSERQLMLDGVSQMFKAQEHSAFFEALESLGPHGDVIVAALWPRLRELSSEDLKVLGQVLRGKQFKNIGRLKSMITFCGDLARSHFTESQGGQLLLGLAAQALKRDLPKRGLVDSFLHDIRSASVLLRVSLRQPEFLNSKRLALLPCSEVQEAAAELLQIYIRKTVKLRLSDDALVSNHRKPLALIAYAANQSRAEPLVQKAVRQVLSLSLQTAEVFRSARYATAKNPHLTRLLKDFPAVYALWSRPLDPASSPSWKLDTHDIFNANVVGATLLNERPPAGVYHFTLSDSADDLLLCGTEVQGSCLSVDGLADYNRGLLGYVLDGKIKLLAIKDAGGELVARQVLRLMFDRNMEPVLHVDKLYANSGFDHPTFQAVLTALLRNYADFLQVPCVNFELDTPRYPLISCGSNAPYEYVDAAGGLYTNDPYFIARERELLN